MHLLRIIVNCFIPPSGDLLGIDEPQATPTTVVHTPNLLDISTPDHPTSQTGSATGQTGSEMSIQPTTTSLLDDLATLDSSDLLSSSLASSGTALMLYEGGVGSVRVPAELAQFPVASGWDNKVYVPYRMVVHALV